MKNATNKINHFVYVIDMSYSMRENGKAKAVVKVADEEIAHLARRSQELGQETRVSIYLFDNNVSCAIWDMDVLRLPSIASMYDPDNATALIDASMVAIDDLSHTPQKYGDHAFFMVVLTDGQENRSRNSAAALSRCIAALPDNWTAACLVPDEEGVRHAQECGFPQSNIAIWDATSGSGVERAGGVIRDVGERFMAGRERGERRMRDVFSTGVEAVNARTIQQADLKALPPHSFRLLDIKDIGQIRPFVESKGIPYVKGHAYYQLTKREEIQPQKELAVMHKATGEIYTGPQARDLVGLPDAHVKVSPTFNPSYTVFVQSTSVNRKLLPNTQLLVLGDF
jgi:hypothetical protein